MAANGNRDRAEALAKLVTVGIVTALPEERAAMLTMFDRTFPYSFTGKGAGLVYDLGELPAHHGGRHVVALALADMGNNVAAARGTLLLQHFPRVEAIVMVGIAGGVPSPDKADDHVRLGDVVVSDRRGVIQYDFVKKTHKVSEVRASPRPPHARLLEAVRLLDSDALTGIKPWEGYAERAAHLPGAARPDAASDVLLASRKPFVPVKHPVDGKRTEKQPRVFTGPIASGNALLKDPVWRDRLRDVHSVKAVEMETSGIADATWEHGVGYLAVRGICDYCDANKNDDWHMYAAVVAAAYARALLGRMAAKEQIEPSSGTSRTPNNLRARNRYFRGREDEMATLKTALGQDQKATITHASVFGLGGIGKTALALEFCHRAVDDGTYPGGVWWMVAEGNPVDALVSFAPVLRATAPADVQVRLPETETRADVLAEQVRLALQGQTAASLLVLDNVTAPEWSRLIPGGAVRVLATTLNENLAIGVAYPLGMLSREQARDVADAIAGETRDGLEVQARDRVLVTELGGLAVAVEMAARAVKKWFRGAWTAYELVLRNETEQLLEDPKLYGQYARGVFAAIDLSINKCDAESRVALEGAATLAPEAMPMDWALGVAGIEANSLAARRAMAGLRELGLVTVDDEKAVVSMHRLVHRRVRARAETEHKVRWDDLASRASECVATWMESAVRFRQTLAEMQQVDTRREHVDRALATVEGVGSELVWIRIADRLARYLANRARYDESLTLFQRAMTKAERLTPPNPSRVTISLSNLATAYKDLGQPSNARGLLERALVIDEATYGLDHPEVATDLSNLATVHQDLGQPAAALPLVNRALAIGEARYGRDHPSVVASLSNLAMVHLALGQPAEALPPIERALDIVKVAHGPEHPTFALMISNLAAVHQALGQPAKALLLFERALHINEATHGPNHPDVALCLSNLAEAHRALGQFADALPLLERALAIDEALHRPDHPNVALRLSNLALVHHALGQSAAALPLILRALAIDQPDHLVVAMRLSTLATVLSALGQPVAALTLLECTLAIWETHIPPDHPNLAVLRNILAAIKKVHS